MPADAVESPVLCDPGLRVRCVHFCCQSGSHNGKLKEQFDRYLIIRKSEKQESGYTVNVREDVLAEEPAHAGWLVLVSNHITDAAAFCFR